MPPRTRQMIGPLLGTLCPLAIYLFFRINPARDPILHFHVGHFYIVSVVSAIAAIVAIIVGISGSRLRNIQVIFLSMAFISLAMIFLLHGLSTPGFLIPATPLPPIAAQISVMLTAYWLWMSVQPTDRPIIVLAAQYQRWLVPGWTALLAVAVAIAMKWPELSQLLPLNHAPLSIVSSAFTLTLATIAAFRYWESYRYSRLPLQIAFVYGAGWLAGAQIIISTGELWRASWWLYHFLLLAGVLTLVGGLVAQYGLGASLGLVVGGLSTASIESRLQAALSPGVRRLIAATEAKDPYTAGHNYRVAMYGLRLAQAMTLPQEALRALAQGAIVHDVGKIDVPDTILNKRGALTDGEREQIEQHPVMGYDMCRHMGFMKEELDLIRSHHERWDGQGYPDGLAGDHIPLLARIVAVADVYDALTSDRAYREAWNHTAAQAYLSKGAGTQFDPACVKAWLRLFPEASNARQTVPLDSPQHAESLLEVGSS